MSKCTEIHDDIAKALQGTLDAGNQTVVKVGPSIEPSNQPRVYHIPCEDAKVIWHTFPTGGVNKAFDCNSGSACAQVGMLVDQIIGSITPEEGEAIPVNFREEEQIVNEIISNMENTDSPSVEISR